MSCGSLSYEWMDDWGSPPADAFGGAGWAHHDLAVTADQKIVGFQSGGDAVCLFGQDGRLADSWPSGLALAHGMAVTGSPREERLWIADPGFKMIPGGSGGYKPHIAVADLHIPVVLGRVVAFDLSGNFVTDLPMPDLPVYISGRYSPTAVAVHDGPDGDGSIWVADGYGQNLVHKFSSDGELQFTLTGDERGGAICLPALVVDRLPRSPHAVVHRRSAKRSTSGV